jgi:hypothetical protein
MQKQTAVKLPPRVLWHCENCAYLYTTQPALVTTQTEWINDLNMELGSRLPIVPGETWRLLLGRASRTAKVIESVKSGWWHCIDTETNIGFMASERWFEERVKAEE